MCYDRMILLLFLLSSIDSQPIYEQTNILHNVQVIGGNIAAPHSHPYQVGIYVTGNTQNQFCGGSLISANYVLTAAHCAEDAVSMELIFGAHNITNAAEETQVRLISKEFKIHPEWSWPRKTGDIALVKLPQAINLTESIAIVKLTGGSESFAGQKGNLTGWGITNNAQRQVTQLLRELQITIMSNEACADVSDSYKAFMKPTLLCTSGTEGGVKVGFCKGDSGGPLVVRINSEQLVQVGVVSFGQSDCERGLPSVYTRVSEYVGWVKNNSDVVIDTII